MGLPCDTGWTSGSKPLSSLIHGTCDTWPWWHMQTKSWTLASDNSEERSYHWLIWLALRCVHLILSVFQDNWSWEDVSDPYCIPGEALKIISHAHTQGSTLKSEASCTFQSWLLLLPVCPYTILSLSELQIFFTLGCLGKDINEITHGKQSGLCSTITLSWLWGNNSLICCYSDHQPCFHTFSYPLIWTRWGIGLNTNSQFFSLQVQHQTH